MMNKTISKMMPGILLTLAVAYQATGFGKDANQCASRKMDLVVIIDGTISMGYGPFGIQQYFVYELLSKMSFGPRATQLAIIQFSDKWSTKIEMELGLHGGRDDVLRNVSNIEFQQGGRTKTGLAMYLAYEQFFGGKSKARPAVDKVILLISDGKPKDMDLLQKVVKDLKEKQVRIVTVAIGSSYSYIQRFRYILRSIATGFKYAFKSEKDSLNKPSLIEDVAKEICETIKAPQTPKGKPKLQQKCFQEKKDILFALDGSMNIDTDTFNRARSFVAEICAELDITPSLIHVGMLQYSDVLNTRLEFALNQYTKYYQVNQSLENVFHSKGRRADLDNALTIIDEQVFNGQNGDRISAEDYLLLFVDDTIPQSNGILPKIQRLKDKGVHVIIIGLGKYDSRIEDFYEKMASHPSDVNYLDNVILKHIVGDLTAITCRKVNCEVNFEKEEKKSKDKRSSEEESLCHQRSQDVLLMIDTTREMNSYFKKALKFFTKFVKRLSIAATKTHVGLMTFGRNRRHLNLELGKKKFEADINRKILDVWQSDKWARQANIAAALREVNIKIFNTSTGGHRKKAPDLIFIATRGNLMNRNDIQKEVNLLREKGVRIAVLDVGYKKPVVNYLNVMHDMASGARDIYPMDFRRIVPISQALVEMQCKVEQKTVSPECFLRQRKVFFMLDSSRGLGYNELPTMLAFIEDIVRRLYVEPHNIQIGLMYYSDLRTARYALVLKKRSLRHALIGIRRLRTRYRQGEKNYLGYALKMVKQLFLSRPVTRNEDQIIILLAHNEPADPEKAFKNSEKLRSHGVKIITVAIHTKKTTMKLNPQYRALASSSSNAHSFDYDNLVNSSIDILLNMCEFNTCPTDTTKHCTPRKQDIFMLIDSSRSIGYSIFPRLRRFVRRLVNKLDISEERTHVGILQASDNSRTQYEMKLGEFTNPKEIESVINEMSYHQGYGTYIGRGLDMAIRDNLFNVSDVIPNGFTSNIDRGDAENILMVYSDGVFHDERKAMEKIENLKRQGVRVVVVGLGRDSRRPEAKSLLEKMATTRSDVYLISLKKPSLLVEEELNEVAQHVTTLQCINIYPPQPECSPESLDLFVVLDGSRSVGYVNFGKVQNFLKKLSEEFLIGMNDAHFGVLQFGTEKGTRIEFNLDEYYSNNDVKKAIQKIKFLDSPETQTGHALRVVNDEIFNGKGGDRPGVPNILILFTDGSAHRFYLARDQAKKLKDNGTRIIGIGAGKKVNDEVFKQVQEIASSKEDAHKSDFDELSGIVDDLLDVVCV